MKKKVLNVLIPIMGWKQKKGFLYKANLIATTFIAFWLSGAGLIFLYLMFSYSQINYKGLSFYYLSGSDSVENLIKSKVAEEQFEFLKSDLLYSNVPPTKIFFVEQQWIISWFLGPYFLLNYIRDVQSAAITQFLHLLLSLKKRNIWS